MPDFNQKKLQNVVLSANQVAILMGDQEIGFGQTATARIDFGTQALYGIGSAKPQDIQQLKFSITVTIDTFALSANGLNILKYPSTILAVLANNEFNFFMMNADGVPIFTAVGCVANDINITTPANQPVTEATTYTCKDVLDPTGISILNNNDALKAVQAVAGALNVAGL